MDQCLWWVFCLYRLVIPFYRGSVIRILCTACLGMWFLLLFIYVTKQSMNFEEHIFKMEFLHHSKHPQLYYKTHLVHTVRKNNDFFLRNIQNSLWAKCRVFLMFQLCCLSHFHHCCVCFCCIYVPIFTYSIKHWRLFPLCQTSQPRVLTLRLFIREFLGSNLIPETIYSEVLCGFPQSFQAVPVFNLLAPELFFKF